MLPIHHPAINDLHIDAEERMRERGGERGERGVGVVGGDERSGGREGGVYWHNWTTNLPNRHY